MRVCDVIAKGRDIEGWWNGSGGGARTLGGGGGVLLVVWQDENCKREIQIYTHPYCCSH